MNDLPLFPEFRKISLTDMRWYNLFYKNFEPYADFSFGNFIIWLNQYDDFQYSFLNENFIIRCTSIFMDDKKMLSLIGENKIDETLDELFQFQESQKEDVELVGVPEVVIHNIKRKENYIFDTDRDNDEYILNTKLLSGLEGSKARKLRREINYVNGSYANETECMKLDLENSYNMMSTINSLHSWDKTFSNSNNDPTYQEAQVINNTFIHFTELNYKNFSLFINNSLEGFILYQIPPQGNYVILNHIKTSYGYKHIFDYLLHLFAKELHEENIEFINFEQDLGIEGLRTHKESLKPEKMLKKFTISPRV